jgi:hypothetical protein
MLVAAANEIHAQTKGPAAGGAAAAGPGLAAPPGLQAGPGAGPHRTLQNNQTDFDFINAPARSSRKVDLEYKPQKSDGTLIQTPKTAAKTKPKSKPRPVESDQDPTYLNYTLDRATIKKID